MPGPAPKRSDQRRRRSSKNENHLDTVKAPAGSTVVWPAPDPDWHATARDWYRSLALSGQAQFYEQSDVQLAVFVAQMMSSCCDTDRPSAQMVASVLTAQADLLTSEGARRKARIELQRGSAAQDPAELSAVADFEAYQRKLGG